jgi:thiol-disulfide isomerase/thioredoxin
LNRNDISNIRQPSLAIHSDYFFGGDFIYKNDIYELVVLPRPYLYDIFRDSTVMINRACPVLLYKRTHGMDSLFRKALSTSTINTKAKVADLKREFVINDHRIIINSIDSLSRQARMTVAKVVKYGDDSGIGEATVFDIKTKKKIPLHSLVKRTSVIMFSGSWCAPCKQILPTVKLFADSLKDKVDFFISLSEYTINEAIRYIHEQKIIWPSFYYNLSDLSNQRDLVSFMKVVSYPTFLLIDSKGNILSMGSSYSGLDSTRMKLASILD